MVKAWIVLERVIDAQGKRVEWPKGRAVRRGRWWKVAAIFRTLLPLGVLLTMGKVSACRRIATTMERLGKFRPLVLDGQIKVTGEAKSREI